MTRICLLLVATMLAWPTVGLAQDEETAPLREQIDALVEKLDADSSAQRREAENGLVELAGMVAEQAQQVLDSLPKADNRMPPAVRSGIARVRKRIEQRLSESATEGSRLTLDAQAMPLAEVIDAIKKQTGNTLRDDRANFGAEQTVSPVTLAIDNEPFWPAVDRLLDTAGLGVYPYGGRGAMALVARNDNDPPRVGAATYSGPFRFEPLRVVASRGLRNNGGESLELDLEVAWEPRLMPIAISQELTDFTALSEEGVRLAPLRPEQGIDVEIAPGSQAVEMTVALVLPSRDTKSIASIEGKMRALTPGRTVGFKFEQLGQQQGRVEQQAGAATVTLERFFKNGAIWELRMRLKLEGAGDSLASHRGWVFQSPSYLIDAEGQRYEHAGFETTLQTEEEIGLAYFFDLSDEFGGGDEDQAAEDPSAYSWVYETPVGVFDLEVDYKLGEILLP